MAVSTILLPLFCLSNAAFPLSNNFCFLGIYFLLLHKVMHIMLKKELSKIPCYFANKQTIELMLNL